MRLPSDAPAYVEKHLGYPVYVKPVDGSQGQGVFRCENEGDLADALEILDSDRARVAIVEEAVALPDFRLVVLGDRVISAYRRDPLAVTGDGHSTVEALLRDLKEEFRGQERIFKIAVSDERIQRTLRSQGITAASIPRLGTKVPLLHLSNLSLGGSAQDVTDVVTERWTHLAVGVATALGLRYCGVDLACADIRNPDAPYSVLEVNSSPGLDHYAEVGEAQRHTVLELYRKVLDTLPTVA
jgi:D-alanine-D-alanine ligase-like ATP-grasp enzyme